MCGDIHVPAGASTLYVPLGAERAPLVDKGDAALAAWPGYGCLAFPGFKRFSFAPGRLNLFSREHFSFAWDGESEHFYTKLPERQSE